MDRHSFHLVARLMVYETRPRVLLVGALLGWFATGALIFALPRLLVLEFSTKLPPAWGWETSRLLSAWPGH